MRFPARLISFAVGFLSLASETLFVRAFTFANQSTPKSFSLVLATYLCGIAMGARIGARLCARSNQLPEIAALAVLAGSALILAGPFMITLATLTEPRPLMIVLMLMVAAIFSICFPICHHLGTSLDKNNVGRSLSRVYASNIAGSVLGPLVVNFLVLQWATTQMAFTLIGMAGVLIAAVIIVCCAPVPALKRSALASTTIGAVAVLAAGAGDNWLIKGLSTYKEEARHVIESRQGIIAAFKDDKAGDLIFGGNVYDGRTNTDPRINSNGINRILVLSALHKKPKRVLVLGLSVGTWSYLLTGFEGVEEIDLIEIDPGYLRLIDQYGKQAATMKDPRVRLFVGDGRKILRHMPEGHYDMVVMNTTWHWRAYVSLLLSKEFLTLMRSRMAPEGVLTFNTTGSPDALKTAMYVFPHAHLYDSFVIAGFKDWREEMQKPVAVERMMAVAPLGKRLFADSDLYVVKDFLSMRRVHDLAEVEAKVGRKAEVITDRNLITEYRYGR